MITPNLAATQLSINPVPPVATTSGPSRQDFGPPCLINTDMTIQCSHNVKWNHGGWWMKYIAQGLIIWQTKHVLERATKCMHTKAPLPLGTATGSSHYTWILQISPALYSSLGYSSTSQIHSCCGFFFVWGGFAPIYLILEQVNHNWVLKRSQAGGRKAENCL